ncbi:putative ABC1 protein [Vitis vinifera]|uniref:Putative ABC1 protein n=1 Tax=Vitis vinifera TaxID=29760 RepID=A0A438HA95_VITVI|nr:putative ABC1 protein [Vitis vinifera]
MATRLLWRARAKLAVVATAFGGGAAAAAIASSDDPQRALKVCTTVPTRLIRDSITAATIAFGMIVSFGVVKGFGIGVRLDEDVEMLGDFPEVFCFDFEKIRSWD